jgi:hypothetical protein
MTIDELKEREMRNEERRNPAPNMIDPPRPRPDGCVTNFDHGEERMTIWKHGERFTLARFGVLQPLHPWTHEPLFQSIAAEVHRLACEVGMLRREKRERETTAERRA